MITPIVAVMGHVDHGKTSLLDKIRGAKVALGEVGGITQSVRAHQVMLGNGKKITFIDTPGHQAFSGMRSRGAKIANIAIIVVAINDGVQPQTIEAIKFAIEEKLPIIIALNKIDLPGVNEQKLYSQLAVAGCLVEEMGGDAIVCKVSANTGEGIEKLLETIQLINEVNNTEALEMPEHILAEGIVLESHLDKNLGAVALAILKKGNIVINKDIYVASDEFSCKLRSLLDVDQKQTSELSAGDPVWVTGLEKVLNVGQMIRFFDNKLLADNEVMSIQEEEHYSTQMSNDASAAFAAFFSKNTPQADDKKNLNLIIKTDTRGSMEVVKSEISKIENEFISVNIKKADEGEISQKDIDFASSVGAIIVGFRAGISEQNKKFAIMKKVLVRDYEIIYEMIEELEGAVAGMLIPEEEEVEIARAVVKQVFVLSNKDVVAGSIIQKGTMIKGYRVKIMRGDEEIGKGKIDSLRILKKEVKEVEKGKDCGISITPNIDMHESDIIVAYKIEKN
jgi:translation initiation factor IF-2